MRRRVAAKGVEDFVGEGGDERRRGEIVESSLCKLLGQSDYWGHPGKMYFQFQSVEIPDPVDKDLVFWRKEGVLSEALGFVILL